MNEKNYYYKIMGINPDASFEEIETAFRRCVKAYHPDGEATNDEMVKDILAAYSVLSDPQKRREYDSRQKGQANVGPKVSKNQPGSSGGQANRPYKKGGPSCSWSYGATEDAAYEQERSNILYNLQKASEGAGKVEQIMGQAKSLRPNMMEIKKPVSLILRGILGFLIWLFIIAAVMEPQGTKILSEQSSLKGEMREYSAACREIGVTPDPEVLADYEEALEQVKLQYNLTVFSISLALPAAILITIIVMKISRIKYNKRAAQWNEKEEKRVLQEKMALLEQAEATSSRYQEYLQVLPERFRYKDAFYGICQLIEDRRVDNLKEALNLYEEKKFREDMEQGLSNISLQIAQFSASIQDSLHRIGSAVDDINWKLW